MVIFIYPCILLLNIVAIFMTYKFLGEDFEKGKINFSSSWNSYNVYDSIIGILVKYKRY